MPVLNRDLYDLLVSLEDKVKETLARTEATT